MTILEWFRSDEGKIAVYKVLDHNDEFDVSRKTRNLNLTDVMRDINTGNIGLGDCTEKVFEEPYESHYIVNENNHQRSWITLNNGKYSFFPDAAGRPTLYKKEVGKKC